MLRTPTRLTTLTRTLPPQLTAHYTTAKPKPARMSVSPPSAERSAELADSYNQILKQVNDAAAAHPGRFKVRVEVGYVEVASGG